MATNRLPDPITELLDLGQRNLTGIQGKGSLIGLLQYTSANFFPKLSTLETKQLTFNDRRSDYFNAYVPVHAAQEEIRTFCLMARKLLSISLGDDWSPAWVEWGWPSQTTEVPKELARLKALLTALRAQLAAQPDYVVDTVKIVFTVARIDELKDALSVPETALTGAETALNTARTDRVVADKALRKVMRGLIEVLGTLIAPDSNVWDDFGLNRPGASTTPGQPAQPVLSLAGPGQVAAQVPPVPDATYYRWKYKVLPTDTAYTFAGRTDDPLILLTDLPAIGTLEVVCEAANEAGAGKASPKATIPLA